MIAIDSVVTGGYSNRKSSHRGAWARHIKAQFTYLNISSNILGKSDNVHDYNTWLWLFDVGYKDLQFNIFGGANDDVAKRLQRIIDFKGKIYSYNIDAPDIGAWIRKRKSSCSKAFMELDDVLISKICEKVEIFTFPKSNKLVLGDSHSQSVWIPGYDLNRMDGKTLHSVISELPKLISDYSEVILYFGNIDIRHHLADRSIHDLMERYYNFLKTIPANKRVTLVKALPIENISRKLPKTGYYNNKPFNGSWEVRNSIKNIFNEYLDFFSVELGLDILEWPNHYMNNSNELKFAVMEKPKSVHLSPEFYLIDYDTLKLNNNYEKEN